MDAVLRALADPTRRAILTLVWGEELAAGGIAAQFALTRPAVSQHLGVLKGAGLISERRAGTRRYYRAVPEPLAGVRAFLDQFRDDRLARLRRMAEQEHRLRSSPDARPGGRQEGVGDPAAADILPRNPPPSLEQPHPGPERPRLR